MIGDLPGHNIFRFGRDVLPFFRGEVVLAGHDAVAHLPRDLPARSIGIEGRITAQHDVNDDPYRPYVTALLTKTN